MTPNEEFNNDVMWVLSELKLEELANAYSEYKMKFLIAKGSGKIPDEPSQRRILNMLSDRKAITISPFYNLAMSALDTVYQMQGATPIGYYIKILQPTFDEIYKEYETLNKGNDKKNNHSFSFERERTIKKLEILKKDSGRLEVYINGNYDRPFSFSRGRNWSLMYELAENGDVTFNKGFFDYFNSSSKNPLYSNYGYIKTKILKSEDGRIIKNIEEIKLVTQKKITQTA